MDRKKKYLIKISKVIVGMAFLSLVCLFVFLHHIGYFYTGSECIGILTTDAYFFENPKDGIYSYIVGEKPKKIIDSFGIEDWAVNENYLYYKNGRKLFAIDLKNEKKYILYKATEKRCSNISFSLKEDGNIIVNLFDRKAEAVKKILINGEKGNVLCVLMEYTPFKNVEINSDELDTELHTLSLQGENLYVDGYEKKKFSSTDYLYFISDENIWCMDRNTGRKWEIKKEDDKKVLSACTDGNYFYIITIVESPSVYRIVRDEKGIPIRFESVDEEIIN